MKKEPGLPRALFLLEMKSMATMRRLLPFMLSSEASMKFQCLIHVDWNLSPHPLMVKSCCELSSVQHDESTSTLIVLHSAVRPHRLRDERHIRSS